ncbi:hypothetical protein FA15DRAFT_675179 [Coprinopsis marcescibilis]|uniref:Uncharacterized protein n=1 Tax=Coprinopsis marcescibilis TaxID=230819 RepID=A0A5C3KFL4_COPMA|nr:hypothetical protein FA15DRAFT_675179 [Coprinopsis marcescibilis]
MFARPRTKSRELAYALYSFVHQTSLTPRSVHISAALIYKTDTRKRVISTLDPAKLSESDHIDVSDLSLANAHRHAPLGQPEYEVDCKTVANKRISLNYYSDRQQLSNKQWHQHQFPANTRGFLYWYNGRPRPPLSSLESNSATLPPSSALFPTSGIRFSVIHTPTPSKIFTDGQDLLLPTGAPWEIPLHSLLIKPKHRIFRQMLVDDGLIPQSVVEEVERVKHSGEVFTNVGQPFLCDFSSKKLYMKVKVGAEGTGDGVLEGGLQGRRLQFTLADFNSTGKGGVTGYEGLGILQLYRITGTPQRSLRTPAASSSTLPPAPTETARPSKPRTTKDPKHPRASFVFKVLNVLTQTPLFPRFTRPHPHPLPQALQQTANSFFKSYNPLTQSENIWMMTTRLDLCPREVWEGVGEVDWADVERARRELKGDEEGEKDGVCGRDRFDFEGRRRRGEGTGQVRS